MPVTFNILLIEDDPDDIEFLREAFNEHAPAYRMETIMRGDLVLPWLESANGKPDLIIMDLNLPKIHGREVLCKIKSSKKYYSVPLVVLTTSSLKEDMEYCISRGADTFLTKPSSPEGFQELVQTLKSVVMRQQA